MGEWNRKRACDSVILKMKWEQMRSSEWGRSRDQGLEGLDELSRKTKFSLLSEMQCLPDVLGLLCGHFLLFYLRQQQLTYSDISYMLVFKESLGIDSMLPWASLAAQLVKNLPAMQETWVRSLGQEDLLKKGKAIHSNILAWRIPWTVQPMASQRVGHD